MKKVSNGSNGIYCVLRNGLGMKIVGNGFKTKKDLIKSQIYLNTSVEFENLQRVYKLKKNFVPKPYEFKAVKYNNKWYPAIVMEDLKDLEEAENFIDLDEFDYLGLEDKIGDICESLGLTHNDIHEANIMVKLTKKGKVRKFRLIDFDPAYVWWNEF